MAEESNDFQLFLRSIKDREDVSKFNFSIKDKLVEKYQLIAGSTFLLNIGDKSYNMSMGLDSDFPFSMPHIFLNDLDLYGLIPHVEKNGWVCYFSNQGLVLDTERPKAIINESLDLVKNKILSISDEESYEEIINEFEAYLSKIDEIKLLKSFVDVDDELKEIYVAEWDEDNKIVCESEEKIDSFYNTKVNRKFTVRRGYYIPLESINLKIPKDHFWTLDEIKYIVKDNLSESSYCTLEKKLKKGKLRNIEFVILSFPREKQERLQIGIDFQYTKNEHPILQDGQVHKIVPYQIYRLDSDFILKRGGSYPDISENKILLIGSGSIGGYVASGLVEIGAKMITIVDNDTLSHGNLYRHILGRQYVGKNKADAAKDLLGKSYPYLQIDAISSEVINAIKSDKIDLFEYDLVIVAIGNPVKEMQLNEIFYSSKLPNVFFTWLEPLDIGGHLLKLNYNLQGCYKCLYAFEEVNGIEELHNQASFYEPSQNFEKDMEGCGTTFTPYGANSARKTASLAIDSTVKLLRGQELSPEILSWKGNSDLATSNGYKISKRFLLDQKSLELGGKEFMRSNCEVCGEK